VYDLCVPGTENFVAQNLVVHNTKLSVIGALWRTLQFKDTLTVVTAPTMVQAQSVWLRECREKVAGAIPELRRFIAVSKTTVRVAGRENWGINLRTATKTENAQGIHQNNLTVICEEASGISREIIEQFEGTLTNENAMFLMIGNPNTRDCAFFDCFNRFRNIWECVTLNTEDSTKILVDRDGRMEPMVSPENISYLAMKYGVDSDVYRVRVLGEFPLQDPNCVISSEDVEKCLIGEHNRELFYALARANRFGGNAPAKQFGIDFARFGSDESVVYRRSGLAVVEWQRYVKQEPANVVRSAFRMQAEAFWKDEQAWFVADAGGMGQGVMFMFHEANKNLQEFHFNGRGDQEFDNKITKAWFHLADLFKSRRILVPEDSMLIRQLSTRQYHTTKKGKLILEPKDQYVKRQGDGSSPDRADALAMCYWDDVEATVQAAQREASEAPGIRVSVRGIQ
jgi:hypothetical protein